MSFGEKLRITYGHCVFLSEARFFQKRVCPLRSGSLYQGVCIKCLIYLDKLKLVPLRQCVLTWADQFVFACSSLTWKSSSVMRYCMLHVFLQLLFWVPDQSFFLFVALAPYTVQKVHMLCLQVF